MMMYNIENNKVNNTTFLANCVRHSDIDYIKMIILSRAIIAMQLNKLKLSLLIHKASLSNRS